MKRTILAGLILVMGSLNVFAVSGVYISSNTATSTSGALCTAKGLIRGVCVNTAAATSVTLYNSTWTTTGRSIGAIDTTANGCKYFDTIFSSGLYLSKSGTASVTVLYDCL